MSDLFLVFMRPLACDDDTDASFVVDVSQTRFGLQIGVFLGRGAVFAFDDHIRLPKGYCSIPFANAVVTEYVGACVRMQQDVAVLHGLLDICDTWQVLVFDFYQVATPRSDLFAFGNDQSYLVPNKTDPLRIGLAGARAAQALAGLA